MNLRTIIASIIILICLLIFIGCATTTEATVEQMNHEFIVEFSDINKELIFDRSLQWIANNFRSAKQVLEYSDKEAGKIIGNGTTNLRAEGALIDVTLHFTLNIDIKDEKARYRFINLWYNIGDISANMPIYEQWHNPAREKFTRIVNNLKNATMKSDDF